MLRTATLICGSILALASPASAPAYDWPLKPFDEQHPVRGIFNDPRVGAFEGTSFHSGVDISAPDLTTVYAIEPGKVSLGFQTVTVRGRYRTFSYWHILPAVERGQRVRAHDVIGYVVPGKAHVHLGESRSGRHLNPLRVGALSPYVDATRPTIGGLSFTTDGKALQSTAVSGVVDVIADVYDTPAKKPLRPYHITRNMPPFLRWRLLRGVEIVRPWKTVVDLRTKLFPAETFWIIFAPGTMHTKPFLPGSFQVYLAWHLETHLLPNADYTVDVEAEDIKGNVGGRTFGLTVSNAPPAYRRAQSVARSSPGYRR